MEKELKGAFDRNRILMRMIDKIIWNFRTQNYNRALRLSNQFIAHLACFIEEVVPYMEYLNQDGQWLTVDFIQGLLENLLGVQENKDWVLLADLYDVQVIPFLSSIQERLVGGEAFDLNEERMNRNLSAIREGDWSLGEVLRNAPHPTELLEKGYIVEYTAGGDHTVGREWDGNILYFHSNNRVGEEALHLANSWYREDKDEYVVYGFGFGYHIEGLFERDPNITVEVYESDVNILRLASAFADMEGLLGNPRFRLVYDPRFVRLKKRIREMDAAHMEFVIHHPSLVCVQKEDMKERLENYFLRYHSIKDQLTGMNGNFSANVKHGHPSVDELEGALRDKDLYIVAAGPSLDKNFMQLANVSERGVIMATGTVFRKLLKAGIRPDYVIVTDASDRVYGQIAGLEDAGVPMIYLSTANQRFANEYKGEKYIVFQKEFDLAEAEAGARGCRLYNTGGSVSTTALDVGITLQCRRIIFLGLDLSYPANLAHAEGTSRRELADVSGLRQVEDIEGAMVYTNKGMDMYRKWMERRIVGVDKPEILDATEGGARIKGMKNVALRDALS